MSVRANLERAIEVLEDQYDAMYAKTAGVRRSGAREDLDRLGSQIARCREQLAGLVANAESNQIKIQEGKSNEV